MRCERCDRVGHTSEECPYFRHARLDHPDAAMGDSVPHMSERDIAVFCNSARVSQPRMSPGWWRGKDIEIVVDQERFFMGTASGEGCNCLIDSLRQVLPTAVCNVPFIRTEIEKLHQNRASAIIPGDYLDLALYWRDIIDLVGLHNLVRVIENMSVHYRVICVDMCWIGHGDVEPSDQAGGRRMHVYLARLDGNHFVPLHRRRG